MVFLKYLRDHWILISSVAAGALAVLKAVPQAIESARALKRYLRHVPDSTTLAGAELAVDTNPRFSFHFAYPSTWDRRDPENLDGATYTHPQYHEVEIRGWGGFAVVWSTLEEWTQESLQIDRHHRIADGVTRIRSLRDSGRYLLHATFRNVSREKIDGKRAVYDLKIEGRKYRAMQQFTQFDDRQVSVRCVAPIYLYNAFEQLFLKVCSSLEIVAQSQTAEAIRNRRKAVIHLLKALKPNELVRTGNIYAALLASHRDLMQGIDEATLEGELTTMAEEGAIFFEYLVNAWSLHDPQKLNAGN